MTPAQIEALAAYEAIYGTGPSAFHLALAGHENALMIVMGEAVIPDCPACDEERGDGCHPVTDAERRLMIACVALVEEMDPDGSKRAALDATRRRLDGERDAATTAGYSFVRAC